MIKKLQEEKDVWVQKARVLEGDLNVQLEKRKITEDELQ